MCSGYIPGEPRCPRIKGLPRGNPSGPISFGSQDQVEPDVQQKDLKIIIEIKQDPSIEKAIVLKVKYKNDQNRAIFMSPVSPVFQQLVPLFISHAVWVGRICMADDRPAGLCTEDVGVV